MMTLRRPNRSLKVIQGRLNDAVRCRLLVTEPTGSYNISKKAYNV